MKILAKTAVATVLLAVALTGPAEAATTQAPGTGFNLKCIIFPRLCH